MIINAFKNKLFRLYSGNYYEEFKEESSESEGEDISPKGATAASPRSSLDSSRSSSPINNEGIDPKIIKHYFGFNSMNEIYKFLNEDSVYKASSNVATINQALTNLKTHIKKLSEEGKQAAQLKLLANSVNKILNDAIDEAFNKVYNDAINKQKGQGLKILYEIRQIVNSLYR